MVRVKAQPTPLASTAKEFAEAYAAAFGVAYDACVDVNYAHDAALRAMELAIQTLVG